MDILTGHCPTVDHLSPKLFSLHSLKALPRSRVTTSLGEIESVEWEDSIQKIKAMRPVKEAKGEETLIDMVRLNGLIHNVGRANVPRPREKSRNF